MRCWHAHCRLPEEAHYCWGKRIPGHRCIGRITHQHVPKVSHGGKEIRAILCWVLHDAIDNGMRYQGRRYANDYRDGEYRITDRETGEELMQEVTA